MGQIDPDRSVAEQAIAWPSPHPRSSVRPGGPTSVGSISSRRTASISSESAGPRLWRRPTSRRCRPSRRSPTLERSFQVGQRGPTTLLQLLASALDPAGVDLGVLEQRSVERLGDHTAVTVGLDQIAPHRCVLEVGWHLVGERTSGRELGDDAVGVPFVVTCFVVAAEPGADLEATDGPRNSQRTFSGLSSGSFVRSVRWANAASAGASMRTVADPRVGELSTGFPPVGGVRSVGRRVFGCTGAGHTQSCILDPWMTARSKKVTCSVAATRSDPRHPRRSTRTTSTTTARSRSPRWEGRRSGSSTRDSSRSPNTTGSQGKVAGAAHKVLDAIDNDET